MSYKSRFFRWAEERGKMPKKRDDEFDDAAHLAHGGKLDAEARKHIAPHNFALPGGRYPIEDASHARNALARVSQFGSPEEKERVRAAVHRKYPDMGKADGGRIEDEELGDHENFNSSGDPETEDHYGDEHPMEYLFGGGMPHPVEEEPDFEKLRQPRPKMATRMGQGRVGHRAFARAVSQRRGA